MSFETIDVRLVLAEIRPGDAYHWTGQLGDAGYQSLEDCIRHDESGIVWPHDSDPPTEAEIASAWAVIEKRQQADDVRQAKIQAAVAAGFVDGENTFSLAPASLANWRDLATSLRAELDEEESASTDVVDIFTMTMQPVQLTVAETLALLARIGKTMRLLQTRDLKWRSEIASATTVSELDLILAEIGEAS